MTEQTEITAKQRSFQYQIWLMLIIVFGVILAGFLMVPNTEEERQAMMERMGTTNHGDIVSPTVDMTAYSSRTILSASFTLPIQYSLHETMIL